MNGRVDRSQQSRVVRLAGWMMAVILVAGLVAATGMPVLSQDAGAEQEGYIYTVQDGDSWDIVAAKTGVDVATLQAANPDAVRDTGWLLTGEDLIIPFPGDGESQTHVVGTGESWSSIAADYGITVTLLQAANPKSLRPGLVLYRGEKLLIPPAGAVEEEPTAEPTPEAEETPAEAEEVVTEETPEPEETPVEAEAPEVAVTVEPTQTVEAEVTPVAEAEPAAESEAGEATVEPSTEITATEPVSETVIEAEIPAAGEEEAPADAQAAACPEAFADYPDSIVALLNEEDSGPDALADFLTACGAGVDGGVVSADLTGDALDDLVVVYQNPDQESAFVEGDLLIITQSEDGFEIAYRARAAGEVKLLATEDVNEDAQIDVVWVDTTCGASTCFDTVNVRSWDGSVWADWTDGTITMAYADIELADVSEEGFGQEIQLSGGIYGSVGAGPQRSRTEIWASMEGEPYGLAEKIYSESECLYHAVLDANRAVDEAVTVEDLAAARALYETAVTDESLIKCWVRPAELEELRSFSLFRLAVLSAYEGDADAAADRITELAATYPDGVLVDAGQTWLESFQADGDAAAACEAVTAFAEETPEVWEILADYGYTNPSFEASDVCPQPDLSGEGAGEETTEDGATGALPRSDPGAETDEAAAAGLPECPAALADYGQVFPAVLAESNGDVDQVRRWLYGCEALSEDRGAVVAADLNGDGVEDYVLYPTVVSDVGLGPDGAQGALFIYHSQPDGEYALVANPELYGEPSPLALEDLNDDGNLDVAWTVEGCSTFCVLEAQILSWTGEEYSSLILPGAAIAEGAAAFAPVAEGEPGSGKTLLLSGGVSDTPEGGLTVAHEEDWQSVDGQPYQRVRWLYDRTAEGSSCMGLRLVEADVALQASNVLGYEPAIELYTAALDPSLAACSIFGLRPDEELALLQGLASFRLIQAHALAGDFEAAQSTLGLVTVGMPDSPYVEAATQWLAEFEDSGDVEAACDAIDSIFEENPDLWQITDHYGYNHPALAAEQICYVP